MIKIGQKLMQKLSERNSHPIVVCLDPPPLSTIIMTYEQPRKVKK